MKYITSFVNAILITAISIGAPLSVSASPSNSIKMSVITKNLVITKADIQKITLIENGNAPGVNITLSDSAAKKLGQLTARSLQKRLQISIGEHIVSEPMIRAKLGGQFVITTKSEALAKKIYTALNS